MSNQPETPIYTYSRKRAIEDGFQHALDGEHAQMARDLGYLHPVYLTIGVASLIDRALASKLDHNDQDGVTWDILWMSRTVARPLTPEASKFEVAIRYGGEQHIHEMIICCGPTDFDDPAPALTIMLPEEW